MLKASRVSNSRENVKIFNSFTISIEHKVNRLNMRFYSIKMTDTNSPPIW